MSALDYLVKIFFNFFNEDGQTKNWKISVFNN